MDFLAGGDLEFWWDIIQTAGIGLFAAWAFMVNRTKANQDAITELALRQDDLEKHMQVTRTELKNMPDRGDIERLHGRITQLAEGVKHMEGQLKQVNQTLVIIQQHLVQSQTP